MRKTDWFETRGKSGVINFHVAVVLLKD